MKKCWLNSKVWSDEAMAKNNGLKPWMWSWEEEWMKKTIVAKKKCERESQSWAMIVLHFEAFEEMQMWWRSEEERMEERSDWNDDLG